MTFFTSLTVLYYFGQCELQFYMPSDHDRADYKTEFFEALG